MNNTTTMGTRIGARRPGVVFVFSGSGHMPVKLKAVIDARAGVRIISSMKRWPPHSDYYCTSAAINGANARAAARVGAMLIVLPEQSDYLAKKVWSRVVAQDETWLFWASRSGEPAYIAYDHE